MHENICFLVLWGKYEEMYEITMGRKHKRHPQICQSYAYAWIKTIYRIISPKTLLFLVYILQVRCPWYMFSTISHLICLHASTRLRLIRGCYTFSVGTGLNLVLFYRLSMNIISMRIWRHWNYISRRFLCIINLETMFK